MLSSGILLWGQLHTVFAGSIDAGFQGNAESPPAMLPGGTIMQWPLRYRSAARNGSRKVRKIFRSGYNHEGVQKARRQFGWIVYHEDVDASEVVEQCDRITPPSGPFNGNTHIDKVSTNTRHVNFSLIPVISVIPSSSPFLMLTLVTRLF